MTKYLPRVLMALAAGILLMQSLGCETTKGAGKDMEDAGETIQRTADRNK